MVIWCWWELPAGVIIYNFIIARNIDTIKVRKLQKHSTTELIKVLIMVLITGVLFLNFGCGYAWGKSESEEIEENNLAVEASAAILMDATSGQVLWAQNPSQRLPVASTTKVMTALLTLERAAMTELVTVSDQAVRMEGTRIYLEPGEQKTVEDLLYAALLNSANDAAWALAEYVGGGSVEVFVNMMNQKAQALGAVNTHFTNPTGLDDPNHYSTAYDLALITREALQKPQFREIVGTRTRPWQGQIHQTTLVNLNRCLWSYEGTTGVKTGYTHQAKNCLIVSAQRGNQELIAVILGSSANIWKEAARLLDFGFANFEAVTLVNQNDVVSSLSLEDGRKIPLVAFRSLTVSLPRQREPQKLLPLPEVEVYSELKPPFSQGTEAGRVDYFWEGQKIASTPLVTAQAAEIYFSWPRALSFTTGAGIFLLMGGVYWRQVKRRRLWRKKRYRRRLKLEFNKLDNN